MTQYNPMGAIVCDPCKREWACEFNQWLMGSRQCPVCKERTLEWRKADGEETD